MKDAAKSPVALDALPKPWLYFWRLEILVVLASVCYWAFFYKNYLNGIFGAHTEGIDREYFLLLQGAITIFCCYVYVLFYARLAMLLKFALLDIITRVFCSISPAQMTSISHPSSSSRKQWP